MFNRADFDFTSPIGESFDKVLSLTDQLKGMLEKVVRETGNSEKKEQFAFLLDVVSHLQAQAREEVPAMVRECQTNIDQAIDGINDLYAKAEKSIETLGETEKKSPVQAQIPVPVPGPRLGGPNVDRPELREGGQLRDLLLGLLLTGAPAPATPRTPGKIWEDWPAEEPQPDDSVEEFP
ncbi:MAG: hypothetical protein ACKOS8_11510 [Gemmataceae bacterium]